MRPQHREIICYHCQQAAEKYLKGFLQANGMMPPKTHELTTLCKLCIEKDGRFNEITSVCLFLTQFAIQPKYPYEMNITEQHIKRAISDTETIKNFAPIEALKQELINSQ